MTAIQKFLFDNSFDAPANGRDGSFVVGRSAQRKSYTEAEIETIRRAAFDEGVEAGRRQEAAANEKHCALALEAASRGLARLLARADQDRRAADRSAVEAATMIARKLLPTLAHRHGLSEIEGLVGECLARVLDEPRVVVRVADSLLDPLNARLEALAATQGFRGRFVLLADSSLAEGDARIEWADGGGERDTDAIWRQIDGVIKLYLDGDPALTSTATG